MKFSKDSYYFKYSIVHYNLVDQCWANDQNNGIQIVRNLDKSTLNIILKDRKHLIITSNNLEDLQKRQYTSVGFGGY